MPRESSSKRKQRRTGVDLEKYLATQFKDLAGARRFYHKWQYQWKQKFPSQVDVRGIYSLRAMAGYCSAVLERIEGNPDAKYDGDYLETKYGPTIYMEGSHA